MAGIHEFSEKVIDYATRLSDVADAAQGRRRSGGGLVRWTVLPASGAALFALVRSDFFARQAKEVVSEAKTLASDLPDDLMGLVRQTARGKARNRASQTRDSARASTTSARTRGGARKSSPSKKGSSAAR